MANNKRIHVKKRTITFQTLKFAMYPSPDTFPPSIMRVCGCLRWHQNGSVTLMKDS